MYLINIYIITPLSVLVIVHRLKLSACPRNNIVSLQERPVVADGLKELLPATTVYLEPGMGFECPPIPHYLPACREGLRLLLSI